jgi:hypothetical protein
MINLNELFEKFKHQNYVLTSAENAELREFISKANSRFSWDADVALRLYAYSNYDRYTKDDVKLFESFLSSEVLDVARKSALWSLIIIWERYGDYNQLVIKATDLRDNISHNYSEFRSTAYLCIAEILFEDQKNIEIRRFAKNLVDKYIQSRSMMSNEDILDFKYFIESVYSKYFMKINQRGTAEDFNENAILYCARNFEKMLKLDANVELR